MSEDFIDTDDKFSRVISLYWNAMYSSVQLTFSIGKIIGNNINNQAVIQKIC